LFDNWVISGAVDLGFRSTLYGWKVRKEMLVQSKLEHCSIIGSYLELYISDLGLLYMDGKLRHRPTTFMGAQDLTRPFSSLNYSNNEEV